MKDDSRNVHTYASFDDYRRLVESRGSSAARAALDRGNRVILGLRVENNTRDAMQADDPRTRIDESRAGTGLYNDRIMVIWKDRLGIGHVEEFNRANTEPTAQYDVHARGQIRKPRKIQGVDVDGDRSPDLGRLTDGTIEMVAATHDATRSRFRETGRSKEFALRPSQDAVRSGARRVERDSNGDGWFTQADRNGVDRLNDTFKIHPGAISNTGSAGCQTISSDSYDRFVDTIRANPAQTRWQYVLVTVDSTMFKYVQAGRRGGDPVALDPSGRGLHGAHHPQHALFKSILGKVQEEDRRLGRSSDKRSENLAGALTLAAYTAGLRQADEFHFNAEGSRAVVVDQPDRAGMARKVTSVDVGEAVNTPIERSEQALQQATPAVGHTALQPPMSPRPAAQPALSR